MHDMNEQKRLFRMIQQVSFVLYETALYLDTHPHCRPALAYFNKYNARRRELMEKYESKYGPLTMYGQNCSSDHWQWVETPWPWEYDCQ
ncbi:MAG: spore coat protein CotJB [Ruminococcaceae bacterium]|nr:spore coat protein CotJB [Oscillospiraceae bacterium]